MATTTYPSSSAAGKSPFACTRCAVRKVKCDRQRPCSACVNHKVDCIYKPPRPPQRRQRHVKEQILADRLRHYETLLQEQGIDPSKAPATPSSGPRLRARKAITPVSENSHLQTPCSIGSESSGSVTKSRIIHGQGRSIFVDNLWSRVAEEFHHPEDALENGSDDSNDPEASDEDFTYVLRSRSRFNSSSCHPPPKCILELWQIFLENVDPLTKIVHAPTLRPAFEKAMGNITSIPRSFEALMFAIYSTAVLSSNDDECKQRFGEPRRILLSRYINATKAALSRAKFMGTNSLVVLQALILHCISVQDIYEPRAVWSLTGMAVRIAQGMGMERDGTSLGLSPFETEMRRRVWWLLKIRDHRGAELCGLPKFRDLHMGLECTKWPTNVDDDQLYPGMSSLPAESKTLTDAAFIVHKYEFVNFAAGQAAKLRQHGKEYSQSNTKQDLASGGGKGDIDEALQEIEDRLETKYLRYCDPSQPLHLMTMLGARASMNTIRFMTHHPRKWGSMQQTPRSERQWVWEAGIKLLEQHSMLTSNPQLRRFAWYASFCLQWHIIIHVLDTLRAEPLMEDAEKAWRLISDIYETNPAMMFDTRRPIHVAVGNLCLKAYSARESALLQNKNKCPPAVPKYIVQLRSQREAAKAKRQERDSKSGHFVDRGLYGRVKARDTTDGGVMALGHPSEFTLPQQPTLSHLPSLAYNGGGTQEGDPFWSINGFDDGQISSLDHAMDLDLGLMLAQDHGMENENSQAFTWEQWDSWLAESSITKSVDSVLDYFDVQGQQ